MRKEEDVDEYYNIISVILLCISACSSHSASVHCICCLCSVTHLSERIGKSFILATLILPNLYHVISVQVCNMLVGAYGLHRVL